MISVNLAEDSYVPPPAEMAAALARLSVGATADYYGTGGAVAAFEAQVAAFLGKERAVMFPTGTLGNLMALKVLAGGPGRVIVHRDSHLFNDAGDNLTLAGLTMVPLAGEGAGFGADQLRAELARTASARVASRIAAVAIESPSRRHHGQRFGPELPSVIASAREAAVPLFLDGARMLIECGWTGQAPADMAAPFDLVYLSLYKYLKAPFGCVIAGPAALLDDLYHDRRRHGGSLYQMWPAAILAAEALPQQAAIWREAKAAGEAVMRHLAEAGAPVQPVPEGTNVFLLRCDLPAERLKQAATAHALVLPPPAEGRLALKINETWCRLPPGELARRLLAATRA